MYKDLITHFYEESQDNPDSAMWKAADAIEQLLTENQLLKQEVKHLDYLLRFK